MTRRPRLIPFAVLATLLVLPAHAAWPPAIPSPILLTVRETAGIARTAEVVRSGVPLPRALDLRTTGVFAIVGPLGPVAAEFQILARWDAGLSVATAPIQWLLVAFPATVSASGSTSYRLVTDGSVANPAPASPVSVSQNGNQVTVTTGAATFRVGGGNALFDDIRLAGGATVVTGGALTGRIAATDTAHTTTRRVLVEHAGPLFATVVVDGAYGLAAVGGGVVGSKRRYVFTSGSPTAQVRHVVSWEGDRCGAGNITCGGSPNGLQVQSLRDTLALGFTAPYAMAATGSRAGATVQASVPAGQAASVRQLLRPNRNAALSYAVAVPGTAGQSGTKADGAFLAVSSAAGAVAIALDHMHRYEPQALRLLATGELAVDLADDRVWLGARQGLFANLAVAALPPDPSRADLDRLVVAPLNRPLRAWPSPELFGSSDAVLEFPVGALPASLARYDTLTPGSLTLTLDELDAKGIAGLMTFGSFPRHWGDALYADEIDCGGNDPTPSDTSDDTYWCSTWSDYHSASLAAPIWAMRSGDVSWLDEIATPAALRMLHTQVFQCAPGDGYFYCGQAPAGYNGYRSDFNSSHAYFDNLLLYYFLTGDGTVVESMTRGASTMRGYLCDRRPAAPCLPTDLPTDEFANMTGRVASQWNAVFRFVGLTNDASYLDDYKANLARAVSQNYAELVQGGTSYGFWLGGNAPLPGPGTYVTDQLWLATQYDFNLLDRLQRDTNDATLGSPPVRPSQVVAAWARTLQRFGAQVASGGDGTPTGTWPNALNFSFTGSRIGGTLTSVTPNQTGGDPNLYDSGKAVLTGTMVRAGQQSGDAALTQLGQDLAVYTLDAIEGHFVPIDKYHAEYFSRLHTAVGRLAAGSAGVPCSTAGTVLCLNSNRFRLTVTWKNPYDGGTEGVGTAVSLTPDTGYFWFFAASNVELVVKVLDGRGVNGKFWVFYGALSDVEYTITVTDTQTGTVKTYFNPGRNLASVSDIEAF